MAKTKKWRELANLLSEIFTPAASANQPAEEPTPHDADVFDIEASSPTQKLVMFTEHRDTLNYLEGRDHHPSWPQKCGRHDPWRYGPRGADEGTGVVQARPRGPVLLATDAAGEGINLQRAHLDGELRPAVESEPPGAALRPHPSHRPDRSMSSLEPHRRRNPRGRRLPQASRKAGACPKSSGGQVFDVLGKLQFEGRPLRELLIEAIRYGDLPEVRARLTQAVDNALDRAQLRDLIEERALAHDSMDVTKVHRIREEMERADARRLQPHYIEFFFLEAFKQLGGNAKQREPRRYEVTHVPAPIRNRDRLIGFGEPVLPVTSVSLSKSR